MHIIVLRAVFKLNLEMSRLSLICTLLAESITLASLILDCVRRQIWSDLTRRDYLASAIWCLQVFVSVVHMRLDMPEQGVGEGTCWSILYDFSGMSLRKTADWFRGSTLR